MIVGTDRVRVPDTAVYGAGTWAVDGDPKRWPLDTVGTFPESWRTDVTILRGGGRDRFGNPQPEQEIPWRGCMIAARATEDPLSRADLTDTAAVLYGPGGYEVPLRKEGGT